MFSASSEARDRNAPTNANQIRLQTSRIGQEHRPIRYQLSARSSFRQGQADEDVTVDGDVSRRYFPTIGLGELVRNPFSRWVRGHSQPQDLAAIVMQYQQPVQQSE